MHKKEAADMARVRETDELSPEMIARIAEEAAEIALAKFSDKHADLVLKRVEDKFYERVGRYSLDNIGKLLTRVVGFTIIGLLLLLAGTGKLEDVIKLVK